MATSLSICGLPSNTRFFGSIRAHNPNGISIGSAIFAEMTTECPYTLQWDAPSPLKIAPSHGGSGLPSNTWSPWLTQVLNPNGISTVFAGLTSVTDWQTDRPINHTTRSVTIGHIYVRSTTMRPKNGWTNRVAIWVVGSGWPTKPCVRWGSRLPHAKGQF